MAAIHNTAVWTNSIHCISHWYGSYYIGAYLTIAWQHALGLPNKISSICLVVKLLVVIKGMEYTMKSFLSHLKHVTTSYRVFHIKMYFLYPPNGPYSLFVCASYFISCTVLAQFASVTFIDCKWRWGCRHFWISHISMFCIEAIELIIR